MKWTPLLCLLGTGLTACPVPLNQPQGCGDGGGVGGPLAATAKLTTYLSTLPGCNQTDGCVLVQTACTQSFEDCEFTEVAVPTGSELTAQDVISSITSEQCPAACQTTEFDAPYFPPGASPENGCSVFGTPAAICVPSLIPDGGQCQITTAPSSDGGADAYESFCNFECPDGEFCDISAVETPCPGAPGVYLVAPDAMGTCSPRNTTNANCTLDEDCSYDSACIDPTTGGPCSSESCQAGGGECMPACPVALPSCPAAVTPADDGRHCVVCVTAVCFDAGV